MLAITLLVNLLIAVMARTFDKIFESAILYYQQQVALVVLVANEEWPVPPPLTLLSVPYHLISRAWASAAALAAFTASFVAGCDNDCTSRWFGSACSDDRNGERGGGMQLRDLVRRVGSGLGMVRALRHEIKEVKAEHGAFTKRLVKMHTNGGLVPKVEAFVEKNLGEEMQDERHHTKMHKHLLSTLAKLDKVMAEQEKITSVLSSLSGEQEAIRRDVSEINTTVGAMSRAEDGADGSPIYAPLVPQPQIALPRLPEDTNEGEEQPARERSTLEA